ncbi:MAG: thioredoxin family protein [Novosphingobium sp.]|uniref:thioredoxin family protein n=1 Tax=Novosphingobium sp. TaxID=1874826 RepID=UPI0032B8171C
MKLLALALAAAPTAATPLAVLPPPLAAPAPVLTHYYPADANAAAQVEGAVAEARAGGRRAVLVFGADWCSDSTALAAILKSDLWQAHFGKRYSLTFIDVNRPTKGQGRNQDVIGRFGIDKMTGTPELLVIGQDGKPLNTAEDAHSWRDAGDRPVSAVFKWFFKLDKTGTEAASATPAAPIKP